MIINRPVLIDTKHLFNYDSETRKFFTHSYALIAQSVEHIVGNDEVSGPIPLGSFYFFLGENYGKQKENSCRNYCLTVYGM